jgi:hypothetical protein
MKTTKTWPEELEWDRTYPGGGAFYDDETGNHYDKHGNQLRSIEEYNPNSEGYTPFGDE